MFEPAALLDYLHSCVVFEEDERGDIAKKVAGYHQFRAMRETRAKVLAALKPPAGVNTTTEAGKGGVVWHTQGSGKSLTMLMLAGALIREPAMTNPTIVMVTDRNDLDDQLFGTFAGGRALLRQDPVQAESRAHLQELLDRASGGVIFTTIHKFTEEHGIISETGQRRGDGRRSAPEPVRLHRRRRALDAGGTAQRDLRRLHGNAAGP